MRTALLLFAIAVSAPAQLVTEAEIIQQGLPVSLEIEGGLNLVVKRNTEGNCYVAVVENVTEWILLNTLPLVAQQVSGEPCRKLWSTAWGQAQRRLANMAIAPAASEPAQETHELREKISTAGGAVWAEGNEFSDTLFYNGFTYKTIQFQNLFVAASLSSRQDFRGYTAFLFLLTNNDERRLDFNPEGAVCICETGGQQRQLPFEYIKDMPPKTYSAFVRANSLSPNDDLKGILTFRGRCEGLHRLRVPIGRRFVEFPF